MRWMCNKAGFEENLKIKAKKPGIYMSCRFYLGNTSGISITGSNRGNKKSRKCCEYFTMASNKLN